MWEWSLIYSYIKGIRLQNNTDIKPFKRQSVGILVLAVMVSIATWLQNKATWSLVPVDGTKLRPQFRAKTLNGVHLR